MRVSPPLRSMERARVTLKDSGSSRCLTTAGGSDRPLKFTLPDERAQIDGHVETNRPDTASS